MSQEGDDYEAFDDDPASAELTAAEFVAAIDDLGMTRAEFAAEMRIAERTMRSWKPGEGTGVPGPVLACLKLMRRLKDHGLGWRLNAHPFVPPSVPSSKASAQARRRAMRSAASSFLEVDQIVQQLRNEKRALAPWAVDLERERAQLGTLELYFKIRPEGGFVPLSYERNDGEYDAHADWPFLVDGFGCIARELERRGERFVAGLHLGRAQRMPDGFAMWEQKLAPELVVTIPDTAFPAALAGASEAVRRHHLDANRSRIEAYVEATTEYKLGFGDAATGLLVVNLDEAALAAANLRRVANFQPSNATGNGGHRLMGWLIVNVLVPIFAPLLVLFFFKLFPLPESARRYLRWTTPIKDGQVAWVALAFNAAASYELMSASGEHADVTSRGWVLGWLVVLTVANVLIAGLGGVFPVESEPPAGRSPWRHYRAMSVSVWLTLLSAAMFTGVHFLA